MLKRAMASLVILIALLFSAVLCEAELPESLRAYSDKRIGIVAGSVFDQIAEAYFPNAERVYFNTASEVVLALKGNKIDAFLNDEPAARYLVGEVEGLRILEDVVAPDVYAFAFGKQSAQLCDEFSRVIQSMREDGTLKRLDEKWFSADEDKMIPERVELTGENGTLRIAVTLGAVPFVYLIEANPGGYEIDIARIAASRLGYDLDITDMTFAGIIPAITSGRYDFAASLISVTEERKKSVLFSEPHYIGGVVLTVLDDDRAADKSFWQGIAKGFNSTFIVENRWELLLEGLGTTLVISFFSALFGTLAGALVCFMQRGKKAARVIADAFVRVMQGTPVLVVLMILYFVVFAKSDINPIIVAVIAFSLNMAAYVSQMLGAAIDAVDVGQIEAARASSFSIPQTYYYIVLPQAIKHMLPVYKGEIISLVKTTSIVGYISIQDLTRMGDIIRSRTYEAFFPLIATAIVYFLISSLLVRLLNRVQVSIDPKSRKREVRGVRM